MKLAAACSVVSPCAPRMENWWNDRPVPIRPVATTPPVSAQNMRLRTATARVTPATGSAVAASSAVAPSTCWPIDAGESRMPSRAMVKVTRPTTPAATSHADRQPSDVTRAASVTGAIVINPCPPAAVRPMASPRRRSNQKATAVVEVIVSAP